MNKAQEEDYKRQLRNRDSIIENGKAENERLRLRLDEAGIELAKQQERSRNDFKILKSSTDSTLKQADKVLSSYLEQIRFLRQALLITGTESGKLTPELLRELSMPVNIMSYSDPMMNTENYENMAPQKMPGRY